MGGFFLRGVFLFFAFSAMGASTGLKKIPTEDQKILTAFFKTLLSRGNFASTLFGQRPSVCFDYPPPIILMAGDPLIKKRFVIEMKGWRMWEKYRHLFNIEKYLFLELKNGYQSILFANKEKVLSVVAKHRTFFHHYLSFDPFTEKIDSFLHEAFVPRFQLKDFHFVQGILFGYDPKSCIDFQNQLKIEGTLSYFPYDVDQDIQLDSPQPDELLDGYPMNLIKKAAQYKSEFSMKKCWPDSNPFFSSSSPAFMAFEEHLIPESDQLKEKISQLFNSDHFLEDFIEVLTQ